MNKHSTSSIALTRPRRPGGALPVALLLGVLALLVAIYAQLWIGLLSMPALGGVDFISFYTAGRIMRSGALRLLYNLDIQHAIQVPIIGPNFMPGGTLPYNHPPLLGLIAFDDYRAAYIANSAILLVVLLVCGVIAARFLAERGFDTRARIVVASSLVLFYPAFISLLKGQDTAFVLLGALVWMWALLARCEQLVGMALALIMPAWSGRGRKPTKLRQKTPSNVPYRVDELIHRLPKTAWKRVTIKEGAKGPIVCDLAVVRVTEARGTARSAAVARHPPLAQRSE